METLIVLQERSQTMERMWAAPFSNLALVLVEVVWLVVWQKNVQRLTTFMNVWRNVRMAAIVWLLSGTKRLKMVTNAEIVRSNAQCQP